MISFIIAMIAGYYALVGLMMLWAKIADWAWQRRERKWRERHNRKA